MTPRARILAAVACGAGLGALVRASLALPAPGAAWPWPTLAANVLGSLWIGLYAGRIARPGAITRAAERHFVMAGVCGGMTTFSAFSLETLGMLARGAPTAAALYTGVSLLGWLGAAAVGYRLAGGTTAPERA